MTGPIAILETLPPDLRETIREIAGPDLEIRYPASHDAAGLGAALEGAKVAVVRGVALPEALLAGSDLSLIHQWGTGVDAIPVEAAKAAGITVARCPGVNAPSIADHTLGLMLAVLRRIPQTDASLKSGQWAMPDLWDKARDLTGLQVGLLGFGAIAQEVAKRLQGFDCDVRYWKPSGDTGTAFGARYGALEEVLGGSDVISLHFPMSAATRGFLGAERLAAMKPGSFLINTARGGVVDEAALIGALRDGPLAAAGLDVFAEEPTPADNPLLALENVVVLPHVGGRTRDNLHRMVAYWLANIQRHLAGAAIPDKDLV